MNPSPEAVPCPRCGCDAVVNEYGQVWCESEDRMFWGDFEAVLERIDVLPETEDRA